MDPSLRTLIEQAEFKESFRGYDRAQVDDTLEQLATRAGRLESEATDATRRLQDAEERIRAELDGEVEKRVQAKLASGDGIAPVRSEQEDAEEVRLTLVMAQRTADAAIAEARVKAAELLDAARTEALRTTADARSESTRERQEGRKRLANEVKDLEGVRTVLQGDIDALQRHVKAEREQLSKAIERLRELLDDPAAFRTSSAPEPTPVVIPDAPEEPAAAEESSPAPSTESPETSEDTPAAPTAESASEASNGAAPNANRTSSKGGAQTGSVAPNSLVDHVEPGVTETSGGGKGATSAAEANSGGGQGAAPSVDAAQEEDAFLSELRKAMTDDEPLGPRSGPVADAGADPSALRSSGELGSAGDQNKPRFGRRR